MSHTNLPASQPRSSTRIRTNAITKAKADDIAAILAARGPPTGTRQSSRRRNVVDYSELDGSESATSPTGDDRAYVDPSQLLAARKPAPISVRLSPMRRPKKDKNVIAAAQLSTAQHSRKQLRKLGEPSTPQDFLLPDEAILAEMRLVRTVVFAYIGLTNSRARALFLCRSHSVKSYTMAAGMMKNFKNLRQLPRVCPYEVQYMICRSFGHSRKLREHIIANARFTRGGWSFTEQYRGNWYNFVAVDDIGADRPRRRATKAVRRQVYDGVIRNALALLADRYPDISLRVLIKKGTKARSLKLLERCMRNNLQQSADYIRSNCKFTAEEIIELISNVGIAGYGAHMAALLRTACGVADDQPLHTSQIFDDAMMAALNARALLRTAMFAAGHISLGLVLRLYVKDCKCKGTKIGSDTFRTFVGSLNYRCRFVLLNNMGRTENRKVVEQSVPQMPCSHFLMMMGQMRRLTKRSAQDRDARGRSLYYVLSTLRLMYDDFSVAVTKLAKLKAPLDNADGRGAPALVVILRAPSAHIGAEWIMLARVLGGCTAVYDMPLSKGKTKTVRDKLVTYCLHDARRLGVSKEMVRTMFA